MIFSVDLSVDYISGSDRGTIFHVSPEGVKHRDGLNNLVPRSSTRQASHSEF